MEIGHFLYFRPQIAFQIEYQVSAEQASFFPSPKLKLGPLSGRNNCYLCTLADNLANPYLVII